MGRKRRATAGSGTKYRASYFSPGSPLPGLPQSPESLIQRLEAQAQELESELADIRVEVRRLKELSGGA